MANVSKAAIPAEEIVAPSGLGGFIANSAWAQAALDYVKAKYGEPKDYVAGVAIAPYVGNESDMAAINDADLTLDTLFAWMNNWIDTTTDQWLKAHKRITDQYEAMLREASSLSFRSRLF